MWEDPGKSMAREIFLVKKGFRRKRKKKMEVDDKSGKVFFGLWIEFSGKRNV